MADLKKHILLIGIDAAKTLDELFAAAGPDPAACLVAAEAALVAAGAEGSIQELREPVGRALVGDWIAEWIKAKGLSRPAGEDEAAQRLFALAVAADPKDVAGLALEACRKAARLLARTKANLNSQTAPAWILAHAKTPFRAAISAHRAELAAKAKAEAAERAEALKARPKTKVARAEARAGSRKVKAEQEKAKILDLREKDGLTDEQIAERLAADKLAETPDAGIKIED